MYQQHTSTTHSLACATIYKQSLMLQHPLQVEPCNDPASRCWCFLPTYKCIRGEAVLQLSVQFYSGIRAASQRAPLPDLLCICEPIQSTYIASSTKVPHSPAMRTCCHLRCSLASASVAQAKLNTTFLVDAGALLLLPAICTSMQTASRRLLITPSQMLGRPHKDITWLMQ